MADLLERYPLATADGKSIPNEVLRPAGLYSLALTGAASGIITFPAGTKTLVLFSNVDCILRFDASSPVIIPANATLSANAMFLPKNTVQMVSPGVLSMSGISIGGTGTVYITLAQAWSGLGLEYQYTRR